MCASLLGLYDCEEQIYVLYVIHLFGTMKKLYTSIMFTLLVGLHDCEDI